MGGTRAVIDHRGTRTLDGLCDGFSVEHVDFLPAGSGRRDGRLAAWTAPRNDLVPRCRQQINHMASGETCGTGDENTLRHAARLQRGTPLMAPLNGEKFPSPASVNDMKNRRSCVIAREVPARL